MPSRHVTPAQNATSACSANRTLPRQSSPLVAPSCAACGTVHLPCRSCTTESSWLLPTRQICGGGTTCLPDGTADHPSCTATCLWPHPSTAALTRLAQLATEPTTTPAGSAEHGRPSNNTVASSIQNSIRLPSRAPFGVWNGLPDGSSSIQTTKRSWPPSETAPVAAQMLISTPSGS